MAESAAPTAAERAFIEEMSELYRLKGLKTRRDTLRVLLERVGPIPTSLVLAQAAIESGWGSSRFSREGHNLFGQRVWSKKVEGLSPKDVKDARFRLAVFPAISASVRSYMHNLNTHPAYEAMRTERAMLRQKGEVVGGHDLAAGLGSYSTRGEDYIRDVRQMIRQNALQQWDKPTD